MCVTSLSEFVKTGLLINLCAFLLCSIILCIVMYGTIKVYVVQIYATCKLVALREYASCYLEKKLITHFSFSHDEAKLINSDLVRGSPSTAGTAAAVIVPVDLGEVV